MMMPSPTPRHRIRPAIALIVGACALLTPSLAAAYFSPEEVLLNKDVFLPPTRRESQERAERQNAVSAERRAQLQAEEFAKRHPAAPEDELPPEDAGGDAETDDGITLTESDAALLRTIRLLTRVEEQQRILRYGVPANAPESLHAGAPLAPTGAGAWLAASTMVGSVLWTLRRARKAETQAWTA